MRRFSFAPLALLTAALGTAALVTTTEGQATPVSGVARVESVTRAGAARPWLLTGELASASGRTPIAVAKDVLSRHAAFTASLELPHLETIALSDGTSVVAFHQTIGGVPVLQRGARVVVEKDGRATTLTTNLEERSPRTLVPTLTDKGAIAAAAKLGVPANDLGARLMILPTGGEPLLVYGVVGDLGPSIPMRPVVLLDATTGEVVMQWDAAKSAQKAKVYENNPIKTPTTTEVTLDNDPSKPGLENALVKGFNCIDKKTVRDVNFGIALKIHTCDLMPTITPDSSGDYLSITPVPNAPEDQYAELSMFYHTDKVYNFVKGLGFPDSKVIQLNAVANLRIPQGLNSYDTAKMANPDLPLAPFDNAFFAEKDPLLSTTFGLDGDAMWFGQGTLADFGYDGDVVYHEFGHFVVSRSIKLGSGTWQDAYGLSYSPGGLNESIADIVSFMVTKDPELGEYTTQGLGLPKGKGLRSATNSFVFPQAITGEVHQDSEPHTAAVWKVYGALDATKKATFEKAFLETLLTAPQGNLGYADFAELLIKKIESKLDAATGAALRTAYEERGIKKDEPRVIPYAGAGINSVVADLGIHAPGKSDMPSGKNASLAPNLFQIGYDAPAGGTTKVHIAFKMLQRGGTFGSGTGGALGGSSGTPFTPTLLGKLGEPIKFTYAPLAHDATATGACTVAADKKSGTCDLELEVPGKYGETAKLMLMVANSGQQGADLDNFVVTSEGPPAPPPEEPAAQPTTTTETTTSCGCTLPGTSSSGAAATFAFAALGLALASRRRR